MAVNEKPYIVNGERATLEEYRKTKYEDLRVRVPKGKKESIQTHVATCGESLNGFVNRAIDEAIERDNANLPVAIKPTTEELKEYNAVYIDSNNGEG